MLDDSTLLPLQIHRFTHLVMKTHDIPFHSASQTDINSVVTDPPYFAIPRYRYTLLRHPEPPKINLMSHSLLKLPDSVSEIVCHVGIREEMYVHLCSAPYPSLSGFKSIVTSHTEDNAPPYVDHSFAHPSLAHQIHFYTYFVILDPVSKAHVALPGFNSRYILSRRSGQKLHCHAGSMHDCQIQPFALAVPRSPILRHPEGPTSWIWTLGSEITGFNGEPTPSPSLGIDASSVSTQRERLPDRSPLTMPPQNLSSFATQSPTSRRIYFRQASSQTHFSCDFAILQVSQAPGPHQRWDATHTIRDWHGR
ncbi:hypothetical protein DFP72DRAFT_1069148 [Ephemerocybe angulata]|uniref:Uncharacterized protein n=1 Tax=Ephemerocybe angulata TaxID=980116 RepID=A0A8H6HY24_9AGAR|nr:hypothetical protein DFP72DRAFT_1069148 [Tulosesus angulatus]